MRMDWMTTTGQRGPDHVLQNTPECDSLADDSTKKNTNTGEKKYNTGDAERFVEVLQHWASTTTRESSLMRRHHLTLCALFSDELNGARRTFSVVRALQHEKIVVQSSS